MESFEFIQGTLYGMFPPACCYGGQEGIAVRDVKLVISISHLLRANKSQTETFKIAN